MKVLLPYAEAKKFLEETAAWCELAGDNLLETN